HRQLATAKLGDVAASAGLRRIHLMSWRDLDDVEAGGSEVHAATVARLWSEAGIEVTLRTSYAQGHPPVVTRDGYRVIRRAGRYMIFPRAALNELMGRSGPRDGLVEIWNGMPFFSPLWARGPRIVFLHHVHAEMWQMVLPPNLARMGDALERKVAPLLYRGSQIVTLSSSSRRELVEELGYRADRVKVVPPGVDPMFSPGGQRSPDPLVMAVGRLVPVKRYDVLIDVLVRLKQRHPRLRAVIVSNGYERLALEEQVRRADAESWLTMPGWLSDSAMVDLYRSAWVVASASAREGWGMSLTEAGACGTPSVATRISGHLDAVDEGVGGLLAEGPDELHRDLDRVLSDDDLRHRLSAGALAHASRFTWEATALGTLEALAAEVRRHPPRSARRRACSSG
ncbi:MAG: glycosyltransferase family 4 protein, partial [Acidimicrobiia bacterium]|nr:glycosyltransferase family 4 protein [Acidimicrobiia bacterium]